MHFVEHHVDEPFLAELRDEMVIGPAEIDLMDQRMGAAETVRLNDALMTVTADIKSAPWLDWLIHVHNCLRLKTVEPDAAMLREAGFTVDQARAFIECGNFPCLRSETGWMVAVTRPDLFERTEAYLPGVALHRLAVTLPEAKELRAIFERIATTLN